MTSDGSVTHWIDEIKEGDHDATVQPLWGRCFTKLARLDHRKLEGTPRRLGDEQDVAISSFRSSCEPGQEGRFSDLADPDGFWRLIIRTIGREAVDLIRYNASQKRRVRGKSVLGFLDSDSTPGGLAQCIGDSASLEFSAMRAKEQERMLALLDSELRAVAVLKLQGHSNKQIAAKRDCSVRTVERQLQLIRKKWEREMEVS